MVEKNVQDSRRRIWIDAAKLRFGSFVELNVWLADRCRALWVEVRHPEHKQFSVAEMLEHERAELMLMPAPFDGYVEKPARVEHVPGVDREEPLLGAMRVGRPAGQHAALSGRRGRGRGRPGGRPARTAGR